MVQSRFECAVGRTGTTKQVMFRDGVVTPGSRAAGAAAAAKSEAQSASPRTRVAIGAILFLIGPRRKGAVLPGRRGIERQELGDRDGAQAA